MGCNTCKYKLYVSLGIRCPKAKKYYIKHWELPKEEQKRYPNDAKAEDLYVMTWACMLTVPLRVESYEEFICRMKSGDYLYKN